MKVRNASAEDVVLYSLAVDGAGHVLRELEGRPAFRLTEFASRDGCDQVMLHPWLLDGLLELKRHFGGPTVRINSGFRTKRHNKAVGGRQPGPKRTGGSRHLYGYAADVDVIGVRPKLVADWAESQGWGGVGRYQTFTHLDVWGEGRRWKP
ncbi:MAG: D-Ala-D-Ala carboxypeptidase family metallohydrolase [Gemmatimonadota bacterium]